MYIFTYICIFIQIYTHTCSYAHAVIIFLDFVDPFTEFWFHLEPRTLRLVRSESIALSSLLADEADVTTRVLLLLGIFHRDSQTPFML